MTTRLFLIAALLAFAPAATRAQQDEETARDIHNQVSALASAPDAAARREAILSRLQTMGLEPETMWFDPPGDRRVGRRGANIVVDMPSHGGPVILLTAHYDRIERGQGVIDNAAGVAAILEIAQRLLVKPLQHYTVHLAFFDLEEDGRLGSKAMVADSASLPLPAMVLNFDIFGYGNALWVGATDANAIIPQSVQTAGSAEGLDVIVDSLYPSSDHVSFRRAGVDAFAISLLDATDIDILLTHFREGGGRFERVPRVFEIMHTDADSLDKLDANAVARGAGVVEAALRKIDSESQHQ